MKRGLLILTLTFYSVFAVGRDLTLASMGRLQHPITLLMYVTSKYCTNIYLKTAEPTLQYSLCRIALFHTVLLLFNDFNASLVLMP